MTTIKSYTDLEQSKKLAEILPIESADMKWFFWREEIDAPKTPTFGYSKTAAEDYKDTEALYIPCWSLSALLNALPNDCGVNKEEDKFVASYLISDECGAYTKTNPIDACYEMIICLNEQKML